MGLGHRFGEFLEAARRLGASGPRWVFSGGGKRRAEIEAFARAHPEARLEFLGYVRQESLRAHLGAADVHLASLDSAWSGLIVPSKLQASFAAGRPVLFVGGGRSETADWIAKSGGGWVVDEDDIEGLMAAIKGCLDPIERRKRGQAAWEFAQSEFKMATNCARIAELLERAKA
jgi:glycosyltransferase involved in cell wall biosynthesis